MAGWRAPFIIPPVIRPDITPVELILEIKQGRNVEDNFHRLFERHYAQILRFFRRKGFDPEECRDLTQETFISVFKGVKDLRQPEQFESWLFAIAHNVWCSLIESRSAQKRAATVLSLDYQGENDDQPPIAAGLAAGGVDPLTDTLDKEKLEKLREALERLPQQMRRCTQLRVVYEMSYLEIASLMGVSVNTVKAHLHQAQQALRTQLSVYFQELKL
jgi:RNA polymerase sigma-70 factor, ECF subfamily